MMEWLRKHKKLIFGLTLGIFLLGIAFGMGSYYFVRDIYTVAKVNGERIAYDDYQKLLDRVLSNLREKAKDDTPVTDQVIQEKKQEVLRDLIQEKVFTGIADSYGIKVSDKELAADVQRFPAFQKNGRFDQGQYFNALYYGMHMTPEEFEESQRHTLLINKLRQLIMGSVKVTDSELSEAYSREHNGDMKNFAKERDEYLKTYLNKKGSQVMQDWYNSINSQIKIQVYLDQIEKRLGQTK